MNNLTSSYSNIKIQDIYNIINNPSSDPRQHIKDKVSGIETNMESEPVSDQIQRIKDKQNTYSANKYLNEIIKDFYDLFNHVYTLRGSPNPSNYKNAGFFKTTNGRQFFNDKKFAQIMMGQDQGYPNNVTKQMFNITGNQATSGGTKKKSNIIYKKKIKKVSTNKKK